MNSPTLTSRIRGGLFTLPVIACMLLGFGFLSTSAEAKGLRQDFGKARTLFERGKHAKSAKILKRILRRYPDHKPSYYLLGRMYYRAGRLKKAARYFRKSGPGFLGTGGAFEYGLSMFSVGRCREALRGLRRVRGRYADLAYFYTGVCHARAKRWYPAEAALQLARRLPANLAGAKRRMLIEIQRQKRQERIGAIPRPLPYVPLPPQPAPQPYPQYQVPGQPYLPPGPGAPPPESYADDDDDDKKEAPKPAEPQEGIGFNITPRVEYYTRTRTSDRHQVGKETKTYQGPRGGVEAQIRYDFKPDRYKRQAALVVDGSLDAKSLDVNTKDVAVFSDDDGEITTEESSEDSKDKELVLEAAPGVNLPFGETTTIRAAASYGEVWPDFKTDFLETRMGGNGALTFGLSSYTLGGSGGITNKEKTVEDDEVGARIVTSTQNDFAGSITGPLFAGLNLDVQASHSTESFPEWGDELSGFAATTSIFVEIAKNWESFTLLGNVTQSNNAQPPEFVSGTEDETKFVLEGSMEFGLGISVRGFGEFAQVGRYTKTGLCPSDASGAVTECEEKQIATASGQRTGFGVSARLAPVEWAYADVSFTHKETAYTVEQQELTADFQQSVTDWREDLKLIIGLTKRF